MSLFREEKKKANALFLSLQAPTKKRNIVRKAEWHTPGAILTGI